MQRNQDKSLQSGIVELALLRQRCADLEAQNTQLEASIVSLNTKVETMTTQLDTANDTTTGLRMQCKGDQDQLATVRAALAEANASLFARTKELQASQEESERSLRQLQADHDKSMADCQAEGEKTIAGLRGLVDLGGNARLRDQVADLESLLESSYAELASATDRLNQLTDAEDKLALLQTQHSDKLAALRKKYDDDLAMWKQSQADSDRRLRESEEASMKRLTESAARIAALESKAKADRDELIEARNARLAGVEDAAALAKTNSELQMALLNANEKLANLKQEVERARVNATLDASKISALEEAAKKSSDDIAAFAQRANDLTANHLMALKDVEGYSALRKQHEALTAQLLALEKEMEKKGKEKDNLEQLLQNSYNELAELTERLNQAMDGHEKASSLSKLLDDANASNAALASSSKQELAALKQEVASLQSQNQANIADKLKQQQRIADLERQLKALADDRDDLANQHLALTVTSAGAQAAAERELSLLAVQGQRDVSEATAMSRQVDELQRQLADSQEAMAALTQQRELQDKRMLALVEEYKKYKDSTVKQASSLEDREKQASEQLKGVDALKAVLASANAEIDDMKSLALEADTKYNTLLNQQADTAAQAKQTAQELAQKNKDLASLEQLLQNSYNELAELTERLNQAMDGHETTAEQMKQAADDKKALQQAKAELQARLEQSKQTISDLETTQNNTSGQALAQQSQVLAAKEAASQATREVESLKAQLKTSAEKIGTFLVHYPIY